MYKVRLPREVAEALEKVKKSAVGDEEFIAWLIPDEDWAKIQGKFWTVLHEYGNKNGNFFKLIDALRYGYEIETEQITVTITPEVQEKVKKYFADKKAERKEAEKDWYKSSVQQIDSEVYGARYILKVLGINIPGVNA